MNDARSHAQAVWRSPVPSVEAMEGALIAYAEEVTAGLVADARALKEICDHNQFEINILKECHQHALDENAALRDRLFNLQLKHQP